MGNCLGSQITTKRDVKQPADPNETLQKLDALRPETDGQTGTLRLKATGSGRFLLGASDAPLTDKERAEMAQIMEEDPDATSRLSDLATAAEMGLQLEYSKSPAFIGLLVADVVSADLPEFSAPQVQMLCEDDKSKYVKTAKEVEAEEGKAAFVWKEARFIFVIVFSHAAIKINVKEGAFNINRGAVSTTLQIADVEQGQREYVLKLHESEGSEEAAGTVTLNIRYNWLRGTADGGRRTHIDLLTVDPRKSTGVRNIVSHLSNVNHWMMSHDNVWCALDKNHPAVTLARRQSKQRRLQHPGNSTDQNSIDVDADDITSPTARTAADSEELPTWQKRVRHQMGEEYGDGVEGGSDDPAAMMFEYSVADALQKRDDESEETGRMKAEMASLMALVNDRVTSLESKVLQQQETIMHLEYKLDTVQGKAARMPYLSGRFGYGLGRPAVRREVLLFAKRAQHKRDRDDFTTVFIGKHRTDLAGKLGPIEVPENLATTPGHYDIFALLPEDNTFARGSLYILRPGAKLVLFDMDGTITVGDQEVVAQFALNAVAASTSVGDRLLTQAYDQKARAHARTVVRLWAAKGYQPVYLSGRQGSFYNLTLQWLIKHNFPPGPIHLTRTHKPTLPMYASVGNFKVKYMQGLRQKGFVLFAAYGNTGTDARAYEAAGIPKERTFMIGQAAGARGTVKINNWTQHLSWILDVPDSDRPIANVDLLWASLPTYRSSKHAHTSSGTMGAGQLSMPSASGKAFASAHNANLSASDVTTSEPDHPADPEEIPVSKLECEATDDEADASGNVSENHKPDPRADSNLRNADAFTSGP